MRQQDRLQCWPPENPIYRRPQLRRLCLEALAREGRRFYRERNIATLFGCGSPARLGNQDAIFIRTIDWVWFIPTKTGSYQLACRELCGSGHNNIKAQIEVVSQAELDK